jgi:flagellar protein FliS
MLYDRLVLDLARAEEALGSGDRQNGSRHLLHAQEIILELHSSLDGATWPGATGLGALYTFSVTELIGANVDGDASRTAAVRALVEPLRDAWREAALTSTTPTAEVG